MTETSAIAWTSTAKRALTRLPEKVAARRGDYRVIYRTDDVVTLVATDHRADAYR